MVARRRLRRRSQSPNEPRLGQHFAAADSRCQGSAARPGDASADAAEEARGGRERRSRSTESRDGRASPVDAFLSRCSDLKEALSPSRAPTMVSLEVAGARRPVGRAAGDHSGGGCFSAGSLPECEVPGVDPEGAERADVEFNPFSRAGPASAHPARSGACRLRLELRHSDNSMGWESEYTERIFEAFECLDRSRGGFGVGLTIVKALIERCGGAIDAATDSERTVFTIRIPLDSGLGRGGRGVLAGLSGAVGSCAATTGSRK